MLSTLLVTFSSFFPVVVRVEFPQVMSKWWQRNQICNNFCDCSENEGSSRVGSLRKSNLKAEKVVFGHSQCYLQNDLWKSAVGSFGYTLVKMMSLLIGLLIPSRGAFQRHSEFSHFSAWWPFKWSLHFLSWRHSLQPRKNTIYWPFCRSFFFKSGVAK